MAPWLVLQASLGKFVAHILATLVTGLQLRQGTKQPFLVCPSDKGLREVSIRNVMSLNAPLLPIFPFFEHRAQDSLISTTKSAKHVLHEWWIASWTVATAAGEDRWVCASILIQNSARTYIQGNPPGRPQACSLRVVLGVFVVSPFCLPRIYPGKKRSRGFFDNETALPSPRLVYYFFGFAF